MRPLHGGPSNLPAWKQNVACADPGYPPPSAVKEVLEHPKMAFVCLGSVGVKMLLNMQ
jgi:hypothetical protein